MLSQSQKQTLASLDNLLYLGDDLRQDFERLNPGKFIAYKVYSEGDLRKIVDPWLGLHDSLVDWMFDIERILTMYGYTSKHPLREGWNFNSRNIDILVGGVGAGGGVTGRMIRTLDLEIGSTKALLYRVRNELLKTEQIDEVDERLTFSNGVLRRGRTEMKRLGENSIEHLVLQVAMTNEVKYRIDAGSDKIDETRWKPLSDASIRLNNKIKKEFGINEFFNIDYTNKYIERTK